MSGRRPTPPSARELAALVRDALADAEEALAEGALADAEELCGDVLAAVPDHPGALSLLGRLALATGALDDAEALLRRALAVDEGAAASWFALADVLVAALRLGEALPALERGLAIEPGARDRWRQLGGLAHRLRFRATAVAAFDRACALGPHDLDLECARAAALGSAGALDEAERALRALVAEAPRHAGAHRNLGAALAAAGRFDDAAAAFARAVDLAPGDPAARLDLAGALAEAGQGGAALAAYAAAEVLGAGAALVPARVGRGRLLLALGRADEALALADQSLVGRPGDAGLLALRLLALRALGRHAEADALAGLDRFVRTVPVPAGQGFASGEALAAALAAHVVAHPSLAWAPREHATVQGHHTGSLQVPPLGPVEAFERAMTAIVTAYAEALDADPGLATHPFVAHRPREIYFDIWGVVTRGPGRQIPHIHPSAWLSGVFWAELPEPLGPSEDPRGWLQLGGPDRPLAGVTFPVRSIQPRVGWVALFPAYAYHHTVPTGADAARISVAFDVLPAPAAARAP